MSDEIKSRKNLILVNNEKIHPKKRMQQIFSITFSQTLFKIWKFENIMQRETFHVVYLDKQPKKLYSNIRTIQAFLLFKIFLNDFQVFTSPKWMKILFLKKPEHYVYVIGNIGL